MLLPLSCAACCCSFSRNAPHAFHPCPHPSQYPFHSHFKNSECPLLPPHHRSYQSAECVSNGSRFFLCPFLPCPALPQIQAFLDGFWSIVPRTLIAMFNDHELELLISGLPDIDIADLRSHTEYSGYTASCPVIRWFWEAVQVRRMSICLGFDGAG